MAKLPVWATVKEAYRAVWAQGWRLLRVAAVPFALIVVIDVGGPHLSEAAAGSLASDAIEQMAWLVSSIVLIAFTVPCYRLLLLGPAPMEAGEHWPARPAYLGMLAVTVLLTVIYEVPATLLDRLLLPKDSEFGVYAQIGLTLVFYWAVIKLAFVFPVICIARPWNLARRWRETSGNFWRLVAALAAALLPLLIAIVLWAASFGFWDEISGEPTSFSPVWEALATTAAWLAMEALAAAVIVIAFALLTGFPAKGLRLAAESEAGS